MNSIYSHRLCYVFLIVATCLGCNKEQNVPEFGQVDYSFFVAGHTYGTPGENNVGLYSPFREKFGLINDEEQMALGVLTGDVVRNSTELEWDAVDNNLAEIDVPVHFAIGNHEASNPDLFEVRYGPTYFSFSQASDLFIVLDPNIDGWNISGNQLIFLDSILNLKAENSTNIFVFFHQFLWWDQENVFASVYPNSLTDRTESTNFWSTIEPRFNELKNNVFLFAGDAGAYPTGNEVFYHCYDNIRFIASGMGGGVRDNFIIADVSESGDVRFRLIALNGDNINGLGDLSDHQLP